MSFFQIILDVSLFGSIALKQSDIKVAKIQLSSTSNMKFLQVFLEQFLTRATWTKMSPISGTRSLASNPAH